MTPIDYAHGDSELQSQIERNVVECRKFYGSSFEIDRGESLLANVAFGLRVTASVAASAGL
jgi:hypothetical protein